MKVVPLCLALLIVSGCNPPAPPESESKADEPEKALLAPPGPPLTDEAREELEDLEARWKKREEVPQDTRIVGGVVADPGEFPWAAALFRWHSPTEQWYQFCGGSLIDAQWVLTAAHCRVRPTDLVVLGRDDLTTDAGRVHEIDSVKSHESYEPATNDSDIALIKLKVASVQTAVPLLDNDAPTATGEETTVIGWGHTAQGGPRSEKLRKVTVAFVAWDACRDNYVACSPNCSTDLTENMLCAGEEGKDSCQGDSGGGLFVYDTAAKGESLTHKVAGVVSFGIGCALPRYPGVYTKVANYREWVQNAMSMP